MSPTPDAPKKQKLKKSSKNQKKKHKHRQNQETLAGTTFATGKDTLKEESISSGSPHKPRQKYISSASLTNEKGKSQNKSRKRKQRNDKIQQSDIRKVPRKLLQTKEETVEVKADPEFFAGGATLAGRRPTYSFQVDDTDHCETPLKAYRDVGIVLQKIAESKGKDRSSLCIYDPYFCDGGVITKLASLGFSSVINRNRDFYQDIGNGATPDYDVLVTNPPYSGVHMEKLLAFCAQNQKKPFLLLLPHFVYTKDYFHRSLQSVSSPPNLFFLVPETRYSYVPPTWVEASGGSKALGRGKETTAPFPSFWYCHAKPHDIPRKWLVQTFGPTGSIRPKHSSRLRYAQSTNDIPRDFKGEFDASKKRPNPKARKRAAKKRRDASM